MNYLWKLSDTIFTKDKGKVFSCFACGGGSTMGYKLSGFDVIGCNEIDPQMMEVYKKNHNPRFSYCEPIQTFKDKDLPDELYNLDILDGSPPCSSFSIAGNREKDWGKEKKFKEGQAEQVLDTLFFDFIDLAKKLQPKVVVAENVKGILMGEARAYVRKINKEFDDAGYYVSHWLLNASEMGIPQKRERVFFIALRKDLSYPFMRQVDMFTQLPELRLNFKEKPILWRDIKEDTTEPKLSPTLMLYWENKKKGDIDLSGAAMRLKGITSCFNNKFLFDDKVSNTITGGEKCVLWDIPRMRTDTEIIKCSSFPLDYDFCGLDVGYICGMSVPPLMTAKISQEISNQWLRKL